VTVAADGPDGAGLCAVVLAAGAGVRLRPLTTLRPKALCPVGNVPLLERALSRVAALGRTGPSTVAVNAHHHADALVAAVGDRAHLSVESPEALGTAGAIGALRDWVDGRHVLVCNADAYLSDDVPDGLLAGWDGTRPRLLAVQDPERGDYGTLRFAGVSLLPAAIASRLEAVPAELFKVVWRPARNADALDLVRYGGEFIDCGTPADYLAANLAALRRESPGADALTGLDTVVTGTVRDSVLGDHAVVEGSVTRCVLWPGARVAAGETLTDAIRIGADLTVECPRVT
jgi:NDP-sugar pyrophosphorylase family protein